MKKYLSAFVCGFGAGVLQVVPVAKSFSCCIIIPAAAIIAIMLDRKAEGISSREEISTNRAIVIGALTGLYAALFGSFFDIFITFLTKSNDLVATYTQLQSTLNDFPISDALRNEVLALMERVKTDITETGFSFLYTLSVLVNNFIINTIFGFAGGLLGAQIINGKIKREQN